LVYVRDLKKTKTGLIPRGDISSFGNPDNDPLGTWVPDLRPNDSKNKAIYAIQNPFTGEIHYPPKGRQ
jgi:adenine-specific DNA-methyltransferase